ncbi:MAG: hypothetical protein R2939_19660 [Kofleriaceae bacterium]
MILRSLAVALALASGLACRGGDRVASRTSQDAAAPSTQGPSLVRIPRNPTDVILDDPDIELPKREAFTLLVPGAAPRARLRYRPAPMTLTAAVRVATRRVDQLGTPARQLPTTTTGFEITSATELSPGHHRLALRALPAAVEGGAAVEAAAAAEGYLARWRRELERRRLDVDIDDRGQIEQVTFVDDPGGDRSAAARDDVWQTLLGAWIPLPEEPIGVGATWRATTILRQGSAVVKQTATYELLERADDRWVIGTRVLRIGDQQATVDPSLPAGTVADLVALLRETTGPVELTPASPFPPGAAPCPWSCACTLRFVQARPAPSRSSARISAPSSCVPRRRARRRPRAADTLARDHITGWRQSSTSTPVHESAATPSRRPPPRARSGHVVTLAGVVVLRRRPVRRLHRSRAVDDAVGVRDHQPHRRPRRHEQVPEAITGEAQRCVHRERRRRRALPRRCCHAVAEHRRDRAGARLDPAHSDGCRCRR